MSTNFTSLYWLVCFYYGDLRVGVGIGSVGCTRTSITTFDRSTCDFGKTGVRVCFTIGGTNRAINAGTSDGGFGRRWGSGSGFDRCLGDCCFGTK